MKHTYKPTAYARISFLRVGVALMGVCVAGVVQAAGLTVAVSSPPKTLNPLLAADAAAARILQLTHPALLDTLPNGTTIGHMAQTCTQPTLQRVECTLPQGKTFTDGTPLTAPTVATWLTTVKNTPRSPLSALFANVSITAPAPMRLVFALPSPTLAFMGILAQTPLANPSNPSVGAGPYVLHEPDALGTVTLTTAHTGLPSPLTFTPLADPTTRLLKLKKGEIDAVFNDLSPELVQWAKNAGFPVLAVPSTSYSYIGLNLSDATLQNPNVRQALTLALNRPALRRALLGGLATPAETLLPPTHQAAWVATEDPFDAFTAESLLDDAGLLRGPDNTRFTLTLLTSTDPLSQRVSQALQAQWQAVGINVVLRPTEWASFFSSVQKGAFQAVMLAWTGEQQPDFYYQVFHGSQTPPNGLNRGRVNDPTLNAMALAIHTATTVQAQTEATVAMQKELATFRPTIPLYRRYNVLVTRPGLTGCSLTPAGDYRGLTTCKP